MQNRAIASDLIDLVLEWGDWRHHRGDCIYEIQKRDIPFLKKELGLSTRVAEKLAKLRVVVSDWTVVTAMYRY